MAVSPGVLDSLAFLGRVPAYLRRPPLDVDSARALAGHRMADRNRRFLDRIRHEVFGAQGSPYRALFRHAGCAYGDIEAAVGRDGVEATLSSLSRAGVFLTVDEFKGRKPVVRGSLELPAGPASLRSARLGRHFVVTSSGSRGTPTPVPIGLGFTRASAESMLLALDAWRGLDWVKGDWETPGAGARFRLLKMAASGAPPEAWFTQVDPAADFMPLAVRWGVHALRFAARIAGRPLPAPVFCPLTEPRPAAAWMESVLRRGGKPLLFTFASSAVALCAYAEAHGISLRGGAFIMAGEPVTEARAATVRRAGCTPIARYGTIECGPIGYGCPNGSQSDDVHVIADTYAVITAGDEGRDSGLPPDALLVTSLQPDTPFLMINVSMGDRAVSRIRHCGCPMEALGWKQHLSGIRSFEKLTGGGVSFEGTDLIRVLEEVMPGRFGGTPSDYQLAETEDASGRPVVDLVMHPGLGPIDEETALRVFRSSLGGASTASAAWVKIWADSGALRVRRQPPETTRSGKILHLHSPADRPGSRTALRPAGDSLVQ